MDVVDLPFSIILHASVTKKAVCQTNNSSIMSGDLNVIYKWGRWLHFN